MLHGMGIETGVDLAGVAEASRALGARRPHAAVPLPPGRAPRRAGRRLVSESSATILVVDDLPANRDLMVRRLERSAFQALAASSGPEVLELVRRGSVDLVLLDIMMPGMTGLDVLRHAARHPLDRRAAGGDGDGEDRQRGRGRGALARRQRLRHQAGRLPGGVGAHQRHLRTKQALRTEAAAAIEPRSPAQAVPGSVLGGRYRRADRRRQLRDGVPRAPPGARPRGGGEDPGDECRDRPQGRSRASGARAPPPAACSTRTRSRCWTSGSTRAASPTW